MGRLALLLLAAAALGAAGCASGPARDPKRAGEIQMTQAALETDFFFQRAIDVRREGRPEQAALYLRRVLARDPGHEGALGMLAEVLAKEGDRESLVALLDAAVRRHPRRADYRYALGAAREAAGDLDGGAREFAEAGRLDPAASDALLALGRLELLRGNAAAAARALKAAAARAPRRAEVWIAVGEAAEAAGDEPEAEEAYRKALGLEPGSPEAVHALALFLSKKGRVKDLASLAEGPDEAAWRGPGAPAAALVGEAALRSGRPDLAARALERAILGGQDDGRVHFLLGEAHARRGAWPEAEVAFRGAAEREPSRALYQVGLGRALLARGRAGDALAVFERAAALAPAAEYVKLYREAARDLAGAGAGAGTGRGTR